MSLLVAVYVNYANQRPDRYSSEVSENFPASFRYDSFVGDVEGKQVLLFRSDRTILHPHLVPLY